jgi:hypothetical protein
MLFIRQWNPLVENNHFRLNPKQKEALIAVTYEDVLPPILIIGIAFFSFI